MKSLAVPFAAAAIAFVATAALANPPAKPETHCDDKGSHHLSSVSDPAPCPTHEGH